MENGEAISIEFQHIQNSSSIVWIVNISPHGFFVQVFNPEKKVKKVYFVPGEARVKTMKIHRGKCMAIRWKYVVCDSKEEIIHPGCHALNCKIWRYGISDSVWIKCIVDGMKKARKRISESDKKKGKQSGGSFYFLEGLDDEEVVLPRLGTNQILFVFTVQNFNRHSIALRFSGMKSSFYHVGIQNETEFCRQIVNKMPKVTSYQVVFPIKLKKSMISDYVMEQMKHLNGWKDESFPPNESSLYPPSWTKEKAEIRWLRPSEFYEEAYTIMSNERMGFFQGKVGNCWLVAALMSLSLSDQGLDYIRKLFTTNSVNQVGIYELCLCFSGQWVKVIVDDYFPFFDDEMRPRFIHSSYNFLYPLLIEKAIAKLYGSYYSLKKGKTENAFQMLTGMPARRMEFAKLQKKWGNQTPDFVFETIGSFFHRGFPICACTIPKLDKEKTGLGIAHAYSLIDARTGSIEIGEDSLITIRMLQVRDPRGHVTTKLPYNPDDVAWTDELRKQFPQKKGTFWVTLEDFMRYFHRISVCYLFNWEEHRHRIFINELGECTSYILKTEETSTEIWMQVYQSVERVLEAKPPVNISILVLNRQGNKIIHESPFQTKRNFRIPEVMLRKATSYLVVPITASNFAQSCVLSIHSSKPVKILKENSKQSIHLHSLYFPVLKSEGTVNKTKRWKKNKVSLIRRKALRDAMYGFVLKSGKEVTIEYQLILKNMKILGGMQSFNSCGTITLTKKNPWCFIGRCVAASKAKATHRMKWSIKKPKKKSSSEK